MGLNVVTLMGRLTADPELRTTPGGVSVSTFRIAVDRGFSKEEQKTDFIDLVAWRGTAEFVCRYFRKGSPIAVSGSLQTRSYEGKNGNRRTALEVAVNQAHFAGGREKKEQADDFQVVDDREDLPF